MHKASTWHLLDKQFIISSEPGPFLAITCSLFYGYSPFFFAWSSFRANELFLRYSTDCAVSSSALRKTSLIYFDYLFAESQTNANSRFSLIFHVHFLVGGAFFFATFQLSALHWGHLSKYLYPFLSRDIMGSTGRGTVENYGSGNRAVLEFTVGMQSLWTGAFSVRISGIIINLIWI